MSDSSSSSRPPSVKVFGSAIVRMPPDTASIIVAVSRIEKEPKAAFAAAREGAASVHACFQKASIKDFGSSHVSLSQSYRYTGGENKFVGYQARITYSIIVRELDRVESLLAGLIASGANELTSVSFQTTRLREVRAEARRRAIAAAKEKAELYCSAAGVSVGRVLSIEDVNPEVLSGRHEGHMHVAQEPTVDDPGEMKAIDPGAITVGAAVNVLYEIVGR
jgi:uncharacterized protein YggE